jgi:hypothetical protein
MGHILHFRLQSGFDLDIEITVVFEVIKTYPRMFNARVRALNMRVPVNLTDLLLVQ